MLSRIEQWLFPHICSICGETTTEDIDLCALCKHSLPWLEERCFRCGLFIDAGVDSVYCQYCITSPPSFDRLCALFSYDPPVTRLIAGLKFGGKLANGRVLGELLAEQVELSWYKNRSKPEVILPVPLHSSRLRSRGFNQALELLWPLKKYSNIPILYNVCLRVRKTPSQLQFNKGRRIRNMNKAFQLVTPLPYEHVAIMDDVVTTGSTVKAMAKMLKDSGIQTVDIWCICRA